MAVADACQVLALECIAWHALQILHAKPQRGRLCCHSELILHISIDRWWPGGTKQMNAALCV